MRLFRISFLTLGFSFLGLSVPLFAFAAESSFFGPLVPQTGACTCPESFGANDWGCIIQIVQGAINIGIALAVVGLVLVIAYAGFMLITSPANPEARSQGKRLIMNAVIGLVVMLGAWLAVDFVMKAVVNPTATFGGENLGPWNEILAPTGEDMCIKINDKAGVEITTGTVGTPAYNPLGGGPVGIISGGSCSLPPNANNPCSVQSLSGTCFAKSGEAASRVCMLESMGGNAAVLSGSDKLNNGKGPSYSVGLWQINLTTSPLKVGGRSCTEAFSEPCQGAALRGQAKVGSCRATVKDQGLYDACKRAAQDPKQNSQVACSLLSSQGFNAWHCSASRCGVSGVKPMSGACSPGR